MLDMQGLQEEMTEVVAQGNSNVELHREVLEVVESRDLPVNLFPFYFQIRHFVKYMKMALQAYLKRISTEVWKLVS